MAGKRRLGPKCRPFGPARNEERLTPTPDLSQAFCSLHQYDWPDPPCVVLLGSWWTGGRVKLPSVGLIIHGRERQRLHAPTLADMKITILVPPDYVEEEIAGKAVRLGRQSIRPKGERQFVSTIEEDQLIIFLLNQFVHRPVARAPTGRRTAPGRDRLRSLILRCEGKEIGQRLKLAKSVPLQIGVIRRESNFPVLLTANVFAEQG